MTRFSQLFIRAALALAILAMVAVCQADRELVFFSGNLDKVDAASWGTGTAQLTEEETYLEREVLEVETKGFYEGARLQLKTPAAMSAYLTDPEKSFLVIIVKVHQEEVKAPEGRTGPEGWGPGMGPAEGMPGPMPHEAMPPEPGVPPPGGLPPGGLRDPLAGPPPGHLDMPPDPGMHPPMPGEMPPGMPGEMPGMGMPGEMPGQAVQEAPPPMVTKLRALLVTDTGQLDSGAIDILHAEGALEDWYTMVIPLAHFAGEGKDPEAKLQDIALFGDADEKFWVATVKLVAEDAPLVADAGQQRIVKVDTPAQFEAKQQPGSARVQYCWDFDDWDGIAEDTLGQQVTWTFPEPGFYVVTLTVTDRTGRRLPQTARVDVKVEE